MAKDPAFLFYSSDFLTGTMFMSNEQVGLYIRLLCAQHQHGGRIDTNVLRAQCDSITNGASVYSKFQHDESGSYSLRLEKEMLIRKEKGLKAKESVNKRWEKHRNESNTNVLRSESVNESVNETGIVIRDRGAGERVFIKPAREEIAVYVLSKYPDGLMEGANQFAELFWSHYENNGWKVGKNKMKNWKLALPQWADTLQKHLFPMQKNNPFQKPKKPTAQEAGMEAIQMYLQEQELERQSQNGTSI